MQIQDAVAAAFKPLFSSQIVDGVLVKNVTLTTTATKVSHTLARTPLGYIVVDLNKDARIFRTAWDTNTISLTSTDTGTLVSLWIF